MRPIKFRAWDKRFKRMVYDSPMAILYLNDSDHELMQYTGLHDKNGKEIYEGDIVRATANGNRKYQIVWQGYGLGNWWIADIQRDNLIPNKIPINLNAIEVIGNIYENEELLND